MVKLNLAITGLILLTFMTIHLFSAGSQILSNIFATSANPYQLAPKLVDHFDVLLD